MRLAVALLLTVVLPESVLLGVAALEPVPDTVPVPVALALGEEGGVALPESDTLAV